MFLCDDCHDKIRCTRGWLEDFARSYGRCEDCHKSAACRDCHGY